MDPFEVLGLSQYADAEQIKRAYHRLALRIHPDKVAGEEAKAEAQKRFHQLTFAYETALRYATNHTEAVNREEIFMADPNGGVFIYVSGFPEGTTHMCFVPRIRLPYLHEDNEDEGDFDCHIHVPTENPPRRQPRFLFANLWRHVKGVCNLFS